MKPSPQASNGTTSSSPSASRESAVSNASPASPAPSVELPFRTSAPTGRRSPKPSPPSAHSISKPCSFVDLSNEQCGFAYRRSIFNTTQRGRYIVTAVTFRFDTDANPAPHLRGPHASLRRRRAYPPRGLSCRSRDPSSQRACCSSTANPTAAAPAPSSKTL